MPLRKELGAPKVILELAEAMREIGWDCTTVGAPDLEVEHRDASRTVPGYIEALRRYLVRNAGDYDVVDYEHHFLPFPRAEFAPQTLFVARSVLLMHHHQTLRIPEGTSLKSRVARALLGRVRRSAIDAIVERGMLTLRGADLINVPNECDKMELIRRGLSPDRIVVIPFGMSNRRRDLFQQSTVEPPSLPLIAFVGTFDYRKGAIEFPQLVSRIVTEVPGARFRLMGTRGMYPTREAVLKQFPRALRGRLEVIPEFASAELPQLLSGCTLGVFPSHVEGFPFGVLEMLAASLPVIAYRAPGAPMMLPAELLVEPSDINAMSDKVVALLRDRAALLRARSWASERAAEFSWERSAKLTAAAYSKAHSRMLERTNTSNIL